MNCTPSNLWKAVWKLPSEKEITEFYNAMAKKDEAPKEIPDNPNVLTPMGLYNDEVPVDSFVCNWDYTDRELARLLFLADVPSSQKGDDLAGTEIAVQYWICSKIEIPDRQTGQLIPVVRTVLIAPDDSIVSTLSHGIVKSVEKMRKSFGMAPYIPAIPMVVKGVSTGTGSDMLMLIPVMLETKK